MPIDFLLPLCYSSCRCRASLLLGFSTPELGYRSLPFLSPLLTADLCEPIQGIDFPQAPRVKYHRDNGVSARRQGPLSFS